MLLTYVHARMCSRIVFIILVQYGMWYQSLRRGDVIVCVPILWKLRGAQQQCPAYHVVYSTVAFIYLCIAYANEIFANTHACTLALLFSRLLPPPHNGSLHYTPFTHLTHFSHYRPCLQQQSLVSIWCDVVAPFQMEQESDQLINYISISVINH